MSKDHNKALLSNCRLYGIIDSGYVARTELEAVTHDLCKGGVQTLQFRAKNFDLEETTGWAHTINNICQSYNCLFAVNDFPTVAAEVSADILHIGQEDGSIEKAREIIGPNVLIGRSTHSLEQAKEAQQQGFDYIGFGPLFATPTKQGRPSIGLSQVQEVNQLIGAHIPVFCIGGIKTSNLEQVLDAGAQRVVIVSDLLTSKDIETSCWELVSRLDKHFN